MDGLRGFTADTVTGDVPSRFWHDLIYSGTSNLFAGPSKVGKSQIVSRLIADLTSTGKRVIYCPEEDPIMVSYRLNAAGADLTLVRIAKFMLPDDIGSLGLTIAHDQATAVIFDTAQKHISGSMGQWDKHLDKLNTLLNASGCAAIFLHHTNKNVPKSADWRAAVGGQTGGLVGTCRHISLVGRRPEDASQVLLCPVADGYRETPLALAFEFGTEDFVQSNGDTAEVSYVSLSEKDIAVPNPTQLVVIKGDGEKHGPDPVKAAAAMDFMTDALAAGCRPVSNVVLCLTNPAGVPVLDDNGQPELDDDGRTKRTCGHVSIKRAEKAKERCPDCGGKLREIKGLRVEAEEKDVAWGTVKRYKPDLEIETCAKKQGFGDTINYWMLPLTHPKCDPTGPRELA